MGTQEPFYSGQRAAEAQETRYAEDAARHTERARDEAFRQEFATPEHVPSPYASNHAEHAGDHDSVELNP
jgi:hypothetical protein